MPISMEELQDFYTTAPQSPNIDDRRGDLLDAMLGYMKIIAPATHYTKNDWIDSLTTTYYERQKRLTYPQNPPLPGLSEHLGYNDIK